MPALVIGHHIDPVHPFSDAGVLTGELPRAPGRGVQHPRAAPATETAHRRDRRVRRGMLVAAGGGEASPPAPPHRLTIRLCCRHVQTVAPRPRVLSGIQPDFGLHLGNYLGALRNWARDQDRVRELLLHRRSACAHAAPGARAAALADSRAGRAVHRLRPRPDALRDLRAIARSRPYAAVLDPRDADADGLARPDDPIQGAEPGAGTRAHQHRRVHVPGAAGRRHPPV